LAYYKLGSSTMRDVLANLVAGDKYNSDKNKILFYYYNSGKISFVQLILNSNVFCKRMVYNNTMIFMHNYI